jgi:glycosyltransferase involved in cell wall biosynthesis
MGLGKAIVAPRQENIEELLVGGSNAMLFQPGDVESLSRALVVLTADPALRQHLGRNALRTIEDRELLWNSNARRVVEMLHPKVSVCRSESCPSSTIGH